jgi:hypothetical protein
VNTYLKAIPADSGNYISHHGIKGQKWGIRRFQNRDGTRTLLGRKRERERESVDHDTLIKSTDAKQLYKYRDQLSDRELQDRLNRLRNEDALRQMANPKEKVKQGKTVGGKILNKVGEKSAEIVAAAAIATLIGTANGQDIAAKLRNKMSNLSVSFLKNHPNTSDFIDFFKEPWNP